MISNLSQSACLYKVFSLIFSDKRQLTVELELSKINVDIEVVTYMEDAWSEQYMLKLRHSGGKMRYEYAIFSIIHTGAYTG